VLPHSARMLASRPMGRIREGHCHTTGRAITHAASRFVCNRRCNSDPGSPSKADPPHEVFLSGELYAGGEASGEI
jgi:hypothetical protein